MRLILILLTTLALPAWAADAGSASNGLHLFTPPPGDISLDFLHQVFGKAPNGVGVGGTGTVVGAAMSIFNGAVLLLAMIFVLYTTIKGTIDSAHDGEILGKKMSEVWVPIRTIGGAAFLLPLASGYSLIQMLVLWLAVHGIGVADAAWQAAMTQFAQTGTLGRVSVPDARPLAANILRAEVCMAAMNKQYEAEGRTERIEAVTTPPRVEFKVTYQYYPLNIYSTVDYRWQSTARSKGSPASCGALEWKESAQDTRTEDMTYAARFPIAMAHKDAVKTMIAEMRPVAESIVSGTRPAGDAIDGAAKRYEDVISIAAKAAVDASPDLAQQSFIKYAETGGWILAGTWFNHMIKMNDTIQAAVNMAPVSKPIAIEGLEVQETLQGYRDVLAFTDEYLKDRSAAPADSYQADLENSSSIRSADDVWRLLSIPAMSAMQGITERIAGANTSPLTQLSATGHDVIGAGVVIKASMFTIAGFANGKFSKWTAGLAFDVGEALKTISGTVEWISSSLWAVGAVLAYYLPAIPTIWWLTGVLRWLAGCAEAVLAAPLMAAMHTHPDGDDLVGRAGPGYMLILAMVIQPVLLMMGFILAALMTYPAGALVNMMFVGMVSGASASSVMGIVGMVAWICLYVVMMVVAMHTCFGLISAVPDNVMRYVGSQAGAYGLGQQQTEKGVSGLEGGAAGAGAAATRPKGDRQPGRDDKPKSGGEPKNGFTNADLM
jgi:conjugal transfer/type IV secretion protein DotA/TraY